MVKIQKNYTSSISKINIRYWTFMAGLTSLTCVSITGLKRILTKEGGICNRHNSYFSEYMLLKIKLQIHSIVKKFPHKDKVNDKVNKAR